MSTLEDIGLDIKDLRHIETLSVDLRNCMEAFDKALSADIHERITQLQDLYEETGLVFLLAQAARTEIILRRKKALGQPLTF